MQVVRLPLHDRSGLPVVTEEPRTVPLPTRRWRATMPLTLMGGSSPQALELGAAVAVHPTGHVRVPEGAIARDYLFGQ
ncbi:MAG: hypothetical protein ACRDSP_26685 [Pseudonocardiaceae bacterium]